MTRRIRRISDETGRLRQTRRSMGDGTLAGRQPMATPYADGSTRTGDVITVAGESPRGETVALTGTVTVAAAGTAVADQLDAVQSQSGFTSVDAAGDTITLPIDATYLVEVDVRWTDGYRGGGTVQITLDGTAVGAGWPTSGPWGRWVDQAAVAAGSGQVCDVKVTPADSGGHDAEITLRVTVIEKLRTIAATVATPPTESAWSSDWHYQDTLGADLTAQATVPAATVEGDLLVLFAHGWTINDQTVTMDPPAGWTLLEDFATTDSGVLSGGTVWLVAVKTADATDEAGTSSYDVTMTRTLTPQANDEVRWIMGAVAAVTVDTGSVVADSGGAAGNSVATYTAPALDAGDYGLVLGFAVRSSLQGGDGATLTLDAPVVQVGVEGVVFRAEAAIGTVAVGEAAEATATGSGSGGYGTTYGAVVVVPVSGGG